MSAAAHSRVLPSPAVAGAVMLACAAAATTAPLLTYTVSLAALGGAHVFTELRFVEARFAGRIHQRMAIGLGLLLAAVVGIRLSKALDLWGGVEAVQTELMVVAGLCALSLPVLWERSGKALAVGLLVVGVVAAGLLTHPIWTMLVLACLHNWTPVGFLAEGLPAAERRTGLVLGLIAFVGLPALIASGLLPSPWPELSVLPAGALADNLGAYLPAAVHDRDWAVPAFSALVFAQTMHYAAVIGVLPRVAPGGADAPALVGLSRIPKKAWLAAVVLLSVVGFVGYLGDFKEARRWYGLIAAVHAWVELPVLLLALAPGQARPTRKR